MAFEIPQCLAFKYDEWIFQALYTMYENNRGKGCNIYEIAKYITERREVSRDFIPQLRRELGTLVYEGELEVSFHGEPDLDRYNIRFGTILESVETEVALVPLVLNATETMTISKDYKPPQDQASTSSSSVSTESEKRAQLEEIVDAVVHAERFEVKAKVANDVYYTHLDWTLENFENLCLARRLVIHCANGYKIYMRKGVSPGPIQ